MVVGILRIPVAPNRHAEVLEVLNSVRGRVLAQPGCKAYRIYEEQGVDSAVVLVERWESRAEFEAHVRSQTYRSILGAMELSGGPPEWSCEAVSSSEGMEFVERARRKDSSDRAT